MQVSALAPDEGTRSGPGAKNSQFFRPSGRARRTAGKLKLSVVRFNSIRRPDCMSACCLCSNLVSANSGDYWNRPLFESANFVVIPSLGSLVEGWVLIVPKRHFICMGALSADLLAELEQAKTTVAATLRQRYGEICAFEHGPHALNRQVGCGVDHAHLHLVPLQFDLRSAAEPFTPSEVHWVSGTLESCRAIFDKGQDYLYIEQPLGHGRIAAHTQLGSQTLRKAIAAHLGVSEQFSWRDYPHVEVVSRTVRALSGSVSV
jgi:ATP adenylyltransferase